MIRLLKPLLYSIKDLRELLYEPGVLEVRDKWISEIETLDQELGQTLTSGLRK